MKAGELKKVEVGTRLKHYLFGTCTVVENDGKEPKLTPDTERGKTLMLGQSGDRDTPFSDLPQTFTIAQVCRSCGCSEDDACIHPKHGACWWVSADQCSHCSLYPGEAKRHSVTAHERRVKDGAVSPHIDIEKSSFNHKMVPQGKISVPVTIKGELKNGRKQVVYVDARGSKVGITVDHEKIYYK